jgi:hypothetical protein
MGCGTDIVEFATPAELWVVDHALAAAVAAVLAGTAARRKECS